MEEILWRIQDYIALNTGIYIAANTGNTAVNTGSIAANTGNSAANTRQYCGSFKKVLWLI